MATYGEGDPTDNAQDFYDWLQDNDEGDLSGLNYTVSFCCASFLFLTDVLKRRTTFQTVLGFLFSEDYI